MNKKGGQKLLSVWWFFVLVIIGGGIVVGVLIYYGTNININEFEADILTERIIRCVVDNGNLRADFSNDFDIFDKCNLKREIFEKSSSFYFRVSLLDKENNLIYDINGGDASFENDCRALEKAEKDVKAKNYPKCSEKVLLINFLKDNQAKTGKISVLASSNNEIKNVL